MLESMFYFQTYLPKKTLPAKDQECYCYTKEIKEANEPIHKVGLEPTIEGSLSITVTHHSLSKKGKQSH